MFKHTLAGDVDGIFVPFFLKYENYAGKLVSLNIDGVLGGFL